MTNVQIWLYFTLSSSDDCWTWLRLLNNHEKNEAAKIKMYFAANILLNLKNLWCCSHFCFKDWATSDPPTPTLNEVVYMYCKLLHPLHSASVCHHRPWVRAGRRLFTSDHWQKSFSRYDAILEELRVKYGCKWETIKKWPSQTSHQGPWETHSLHISLQLQVSSRWSCKKILFITLRYK